MVPKTDSSRDNPAPYPTQTYLKWHCTNHEKYTECSKECAFHAVLALFSKKYTLPIIRLLLAKKKMRFNELQSTLKISPKTITYRLQELVQCGLIVRKVFNEIPIRVEYSLTPAAQDLDDIFERISLWVLRWALPKKNE